MLRTLFFCDYLTIPDCRRGIHTLLNRADSVGNCSTPFI